MPTGTPLPDIPEHQLADSFRRGVRWSLAGTLGSALFQILQIVVFTRLAGPAEAGEYALAAVILGFLVPVAEAGLSQAIVQARSITPGQLAALTWINLLLGVLIFSALWFAGNVLAAWFNQPSISHLLGVMGLSLLITPLGTQHAGLLTRSMQFDLIARIEVVSWAGSFVVTAALASQGWGAMAMGAGFLARNILATAGCLVAVRSSYACWAPRMAHFREALPYVRFGLYDLASRWADFASNYADKLIVGKWLGATALGLYNLGFTFLMLPTARLGYIVTRVGFPVFARLRDNKPALQHYFNKLSRDMITLLFPVYAGLALFSREVILIVFGAAWLPAVPVLTILAIGGLVRSCSAVFPQLLKGLGNPRLLFIWMLVWSAVLILFLSVFLVARPTVESAAWSRTAAKFLVELALLWWLAGRCGVRFTPVLTYAWQMALWLLPLLAGCSLLVLADGHFWAVLSIKAVIFGGGLLWLMQKGPLRPAWSSLIASFGIERNA
jgi:teichuronic acid exporter